jgi:Tol biopolymer transport system component
LSGDEDDSIPLRLSNHQHVDLRGQFHPGMEQLANALHDHLGTTKIIKRKEQESGTPAALPLNLRKFALPGLMALIALTCIVGLALAARLIYSSINGRSTPVVTFTPTVEPFVIATVQDINTNEELAGRIVYTCQVNKARATDQICVINADGSGQRQLTNLSSSDNQDASFSPDGESVVFVSNRTGYYEIYELDLSGNTKQLTNLKSTVSLPSISSDNQAIAFSNRVNGHDEIWVMDRGGDNAHVLFKSAGKSAVAPTWSPGGNEILFALGRDPADVAKQLFILDLHGGEPRLLSDKIFTPGRTDWSRQDLIAYFMGDGWKRNVWTIYPDGTGIAQVTDGGNAQSPSFSPGGRYITYTAYTDVEGQDEFSCEIFILDLYNNESWQLTDNDICDYQPRWGN